MEKENVLLEIVDEANPRVVAVVPFDTDNKLIIGGSLGVMTRMEAFENYSVIGEIVEGQIQLNGEEDEVWFDEEIEDEDY